MNFTELARMRESCRNYTGEPVPREKLLAILDAARMSPSACNSQPWSFVVADTPDAARRAAACVQVDGANKFTDHAPAFLIVLEEPVQLSPRIAEKIDSQHFAQIDLGLITAHICLAAADLGLGTCIMGIFDEEKTKAYFQIPAEKRVRLILSVGYSADTSPRAKKRKSLEEFVRFA
ncbi:MAG: nitroreductase family protein [Clostridiaceae bacterium]|nr:nitroreductase family protein [Clostridiaceae bacterium]